MSLFSPIEDIKQDYLAEKIVCGQICANTIAISTYTGPSHRQWRLRGQAEPGAEERYEE